MLEKDLSTHESYNDVVELEYGNDILSSYQMYRVRIECYYLCKSLLIAEGKICTTTWVACCSEAIKVKSQSGIKYVKISRIVVYLHA